MKTKIYKAYTAVIIAVMLTSYSFAQWSNVGSYVYVTNTAHSVGIGNTAPAYKLDVTGDINSAQGNAYRMAGNKILWYNSTATNNIFTGVGAGAAITSGVNNTFVGNNAGTATTTGHELTLVGFEAGKSFTGGENNTAVGYQALYSCASQKYSTAIGYQSLYSFTISSGYQATNTACGYQTLYNTQAYGGCAFGFWAAKSNTTGCASTAFGEEALRDNTDGFYNVAVGAAAIHHNVTGSNNTAVGHNAGAGVSANSYSNNSFFGYFAGKGATTGSGNVFMGSYSGYTNTTGFDDVAVGGNALYTNTTGQYNVAIGKSSLYLNTTGYHNAAAGQSALYSNTTGDANVAIGSNSLYTNTTANNNTACGYSALRYVSTSGDNTAMGFEALTNTTAASNTGLGYAAGYTNTSGTSNTFLGRGADANAATYTNSTALGKTAIVTASNMVRIGNSSVTVVEGPVAYTVSDGRFKTNVTENVKGLEFINKLRPVTYNMDTKALDDFNIQGMSDSAKTIHQAGMDFLPSQTIVHAGFIAQEVELAAQSVGFTSSIVKTPSNANDNYSLAYQELVVPLVKAVQELSKSATEKDSINAAQLQALQEQISQLNDRLNSCCTINHSMQQNNNSNSTSAIDVNLKDGQSIVLEQNVPNPFAEQTTINYFLPENVLKAQMLFYNAQGKLIQTVDLNDKGKGSLNVFASDLSNGTYTYTLVADGKIVETKKMVKQK